MQIYFKNLKKNWLINLIGPLAIVSFILIIAFSWPSLKDAILDRMAGMNNPVYIAILGDILLGGTNQWQASVFMYAAGIGNLTLLFVAIFVPSRVLVDEIDKKTFDVIFSYPIPRWQYLLEKFCAFATYSLLYPVFLIFTILGSTILNNESIDTALVINYTLGMWLLLVSLGAISVLCAVIFLDSSRIMAVSGLIMIGEYILESMGGLIPSLKDLQFLSLFHYLKAKSIDIEGMLPIGDVIIVASIGIIALISALYIFNKREFTQ
ncbi:MAG: ABC transporter permease [Candidatus Odinarchaeota archaeon]